MTIPTYHPPRVSALGSLANLTLNNQAGTGVDLFACVSGEIVATLSTSSDPAITIDAIVAIPGSTCDVKGMAAS